MADDDAVAAERLGGARTTVARQQSPPTAPSTPPPPLVLPTTPTKTLTMPFESPAPTLIMPEPATPTMTLQVSSCPARRMCNAPGRNALGGGGSDSAGEQPAAHDALTGVPVPPSPKTAPPAPTQPASTGSTPTDPPLDAGAPPKKVKRKIVPKHVAQISNWTVPRRPFQPVVTVSAGGGLKMLNLDEGDTSDLLDSTTEDGTSRRESETSYESTQSFREPPSKRPRLGGGTPGTTPQTKPRAAPVPPSPRQSPLPRSTASVNAPANPTTAEAAGGIAPTALFGAGGNATAAPAAPPLPPAVQNAPISHAHLEGVASLTEEEATVCGIPLSFWSSCRHALKQYAEWCDTAKSSQTSAALQEHEAKLVALIERSLCGSTRLTRRRLRRESAMQQLHLGLTPDTSIRWEGGGPGADAPEGIRFQRLRRELADIEERKKALESSINARAKACGDGDDGFTCLLNAGPADGTPWTEPTYVQDGAERLELQFLRKDQVDKQKELERLEAERAAATRQYRLLKNEDGSMWRGFQVMDERYLMLDLLGKGGYSEVWKAFDRVAAGHVAVKVHRLNDTWSDEKKGNYIRHARREVEIQKSLNHPNIVPLKDCFDIDGSSFATVMEYTDGEDVATYLEKHGPFRERDARVIIRQVLSALLYIGDPSHGRRVIHYDLKPANILLFGDLTIRITDFGLSKIMDSDKHDIELTSHGAGTLWYLPPECFSTSDSARITPAVDVWSTGVVFYQLLYGKKPFGDGMSQRALLHNNTIQGTATQLEIPSHPKVSRQTVDMIRRMLSYHPAQRPSAAALAAEFDAWDDANDTRDDDGGKDAAADGPSMPPPQGRASPPKPATKTGR